LDTVYVTRRNTEQGWKLTGGDEERHDQAPAAQPLDAHAAEADAERRGDVLLEGHLEVSAVSCVSRIR
jgi:hypothetical protein